MSLHTRNKRKREVREDYVEQNGLIFQLPDETLLSIFKLFTTEQLIRVAGVCKWFRRIAYDEELWRTIDLTSRTYPNRELSKFFRRFPRDCTERLKISGICPTQRSRGKLVHPPPFTETLSTTIRISYPNLRYFHVSRFDFHHDGTAVKNVTYLPPNLQGLHLQQCEMLMTPGVGTPDFLQFPAVPLKNATEQFSLRQLEILSFENSSCLGLVSVNYLPNLCPNLTELNLNGCFRIPRSEAFTNVLLYYYRTMRRLYLRETHIDDDTMHCICRKLKRLNVLDIRLCKYVTKNIVENLLTLRQLHTLQADNEIQFLYDRCKRELKMSS